MTGRILLALASLFLCLLVAEGGLAWLAPQVHRLPDVWQPDARLGWSHRPGAEGRLLTPEFDVAYRIDGHGRRQHAPGDAGMGASGPIVQLYGDSFAEGWGVDVDEGLAARLDAALAARVHNHGTAGYGTDQELLLFVHEGAAADPDLVVVLFYANDLWNNVSPVGIGARRGAKPLFRPDAYGGLRLEGTPVPEPPPAPTSWREQLGRRSHLAALVLGALQPAALPSQQTRRFYAGLYRDDPEYAAVWNLTGRLLAEFQRRVRAAGAAFVVVYAPAIVQIERDDWRAKRELNRLTGDFDLGHPQRRLRELSQAYGFDWIDLTAALEAAASQSTVYYRDSHWNAGGHAAAATALADSLGARGWARQVDGG